MPARPCWSGARCNPPDPASTIQRRREKGKASQMLPLGYVVARILKKLRGSAVIDSTIDPTAKVESGSTIVRSRFGRHSFCGYDCTIIDCQVGAFCSIAGNVAIGGSMHPMEFVSTSPVFLDHKDSVTAKFARFHYRSTRETIIGNDVWIGQGAFVKSGVNVGHGCVIGMGSVVTRSVEPYSIVAGNPARLIRNRFEPRIAEALLRMKWWDLHDDELRRIGAMFDDPVAMLRCEGLL